jgi:hypothetical protein
MTIRNVIIAVVVLGAGYWGYKMWKKSQYKEVTEDSDSTVKIYIKK